MPWPSRCCSNSLRSSRCAVRTVFSRLERNSAQSFEVAAIGADGERSQALFHPKVDGKAGQGAILRGGGHG